MNTWIGRCCEVRDEVATTPGLEVVDQPDRERACILLQHPDRFRREPRVQQRAILGVLGRVEEDGVQRHRRGRAFRHREPVIGEVLVVGEHLVDVLAACQHPMPALARSPEHLRHVRFVQALDREVEILVRARGVVDVEVEDEVRRNVRGNRCCPAGCCPDHVASSAVK
jgi:hypothetical protein